MNVTTPRNPIIYYDQGADSDCTVALAGSLRLEGRRPLFLDSSYIARGGWEETASTVIFGGGNAIEMAQGMKRNDCAQKVRNFVSAGNGYFGICAGAIIAGSVYVTRLETERFAEVSYTELAQSPLMKIYPGKVYGYQTLGSPYPLFGTAKTCRLSPLSDAHGQYFWNLGPCLDPDYQNQTIIARYEDIKGKPPAITQSKFGNGPVVLSGVHPEVDLRSWEKFILENTTQDLSPFNENKEARKALFKRLCELSGVLTSDPQSQGPESEALA